MTTTSESLPETTTERLLKVAQIVEDHPEAWFQNSWAALTTEELKALYEHFEIPDWQQPTDEQLIAFNQGRDSVDCGTTCCLAGWAVRYAPLHLDLTGLSWNEAGQMLLGVSQTVASVIFDGEFGKETVEFVTDDGSLDYEYIEHREALAHLLRRLAELPQHKRSISALVELVETDSLVATLFSEGTTAFDELEEYR